MREMYDRTFYIVKAVMLLFLVNSSLTFIGVLAVALIGKQAASYAWLGSVFIFAAYLWVVINNPKQWLLQVFLIALFSEMMMWINRGELIETVSSPSQQVLIGILKSMVLGMLGGLTAKLLLSKYHFSFEDRQHKTRVIRSKPGIAAYVTAQKQLYECFWLFGLSAFIITEWGFYLYKRYWVFESGSLLISTTVYLLLRIMVWVIIYRCSVNVYRLSWKFASQGALFLDMVYVLSSFTEAVLAAKSAIRL